MYRLLLGQTVGQRYHIISLLGRGGMGAVYLAMDTTLERHVALKAVTIAEDGEAGAAARARFRREARIAASLHHPNVVTVHDFLSDERLDLEFLVMEHLVGQDLGQRVKTGGPLPPDEVTDILAQAADGVNAGHQVGLVHRDLKPANLFLSSRGASARHHVHVLDFGIAKAAEQAGTATHFTMFGRHPLSPGYASPEQWRGVEEIRPSSDVFSLGMTGYFALTGVPPYSQERLLAMSQGADPPPLVFSQAFPSFLEEALRRALAPRPEDRFADAGQFAAALAGTADLAPPPTRQHRGRREATAHPNPVIADSRHLAPGAHTAYGRKSAHPSHSTALVNTALAAVGLVALAFWIGSVSVGAPLIREGLTGPPEGIVGVPPSTDDYSNSSAPEVRSRPVKKKPRSVSNQDRSDEPRGSYRADESTPSYVDTPGQSAPQDDAGVYDISSVEVKPALSNGSDVARALERNYPPLLRDAGVGGTVMLSFRVNEDGRVDPTTIEVVSSDNEQFSEAAKKVVERMRFSPAKLNDRPVKVLVQIPITFQPQS
jgi:TonB family protein